MKIAKPTVCAAQEKFFTTRRELAAALIERDDDIDFVLTSLICQENPLLVGPPGCAKSLLLDSHSFELASSAQRFRTDELRT